MVSGTFVLTDTINKAFDSIFQDSYSKTERGDLRQARSSRTPPAAPPRCPQRSLDRVRAERDVAEAVGRDLQPQRARTRPSSSARTARPLGSSNNGQFGFGFDPHAERFNPLSLTTGRWAPGPGRSSSTRAPRRSTATAWATAIGVAARGPVRQYTITGIARYGTVNSHRRRDDRRLRRPDRAGAAGQARPVRHDLRRRARRRLLRRSSCASCGRSCPAAAQVKTGAAAGRRATRRTRRSTASSSSTSCSAFGFIALGRRRLRDLQHALDHARPAHPRARHAAHARRLAAAGHALGADSRAWSWASFASVVGLVLGIGLAKGLNALFKAFGVDLPQSRHGHRARARSSSRWSLGIVVTLLASISPARRATRIAPSPPCARARRCRRRLGRAGRRSRSRSSPSRVALLGLAPPASGRSAVADPRRHRRAGAVPRRAHDRRPARPADRRACVGRPARRFGGPPAGWPARTPRATRRARPPPRPR